MFFGYWKQFSIFFCEEICEMYKQISEKLSQTPPFSVFVLGPSAALAPSCAELLLTETLMLTSATGGLSSSVNCSELPPSFLSLWPLCSVTTFTGWCTFI